MESKMNLLQELNEMKEPTTEDLPDSDDVMDEIENMLRGVAARASKYQTKDSSSAAAPDSSRFRASHSGKVELAMNVTSHGYGGATTRYNIALKIGTAIGRENVSKVKKDIQDEFDGLASDYGVEGKTIKTSDGKRITLRDSDGTNYKTVGVTVS